MEESFSKAISLVEWPDRLPQVPVCHLYLRLVDPSSEDDGILARMERNDSNDDGGVERDDDGGGVERDDDSSGMDEDIDGMPRCIVIRGHGGRWRQPLLTLKGHIEQRGSQIGLHILGNNTIS